MKKVLFGALLVAITAFGAQSLQGQTCNKFSKITKDILGTGKPGEDWTSIGPRRWVANTNHTGRIVGPGDRTFISEEPLEKDNVTVKITETDGKGEVKVRICRVDALNRYYFLKERIFNDNSSRKDNKSEQREIKLSNVKGNLLVLTFDGQSATNTFSYRLRLIQ